MKIEIPKYFQPPQLKPYPSDNLDPFENWFVRNYDQSRNKSDRVFLPVTWTSFYCNNKHGRDRKEMNKLDAFINSLDRGKKYFTVVQYDDGIINKLPFLDVKVFGMGCKGEVQLPLVCQPHKYEFKENGRPIFASFIGSITHPIRQKLVDELKDKEGYFISTEPTSLHSYCYIMSQSKFVLCPRGYGKTSFRIQEALQYGAIPIYISDEHLFSEGTVPTGLNFDLSVVSDEVIKLKQNMIGFQYKDNYTYQAVANMIYENLHSV
jgi:hypothetical protein